MTYGYTGNVCLGIDSSRLGFAPLTIERYSLGPLGVTVSLSSGQTLVIMITGYRNTDTSKENKTGNEDNRYSDQGVDHGDTDNLSSGFVNVSRSKGNGIRKQRFARELREYAGVNKGVQIPLLTIDRKVFRVMSAYFRTCRVTRLTGSSPDYRRNEK